MTNEKNIELKTNLSLYVPSINLILESIRLNENPYSLFSMRFSSEQELESHPCEELYSTVVNKKEIIITQNIELGIQRAVIFLYTAAKLAEKEYIKNKNNTNIDPVVLSNLLSDFKNDFSIPVYKIKGQYNATKSKIVKSLDIKI
tara:strand:- start:58059 stop:58493 length:435 start_codon:yes stop_codon:yes gene_type:complete